MGRLAETFERVARDRRKAYIGYVMAGFPSAEGAQALAQGLLERGADILELGVPFSDPIADGVVIQQAGEKALAAGGGLAGTLDLARRLRAVASQPLVLMSYLNPLLSMGLETFCHGAKVAGVDAVVVPDLPPEEAGQLSALCKGAGLDLVLLAAPTSTPARLKAIAKAATGFIYVVSVAGVTGERKAFDQRLRGVVAELRRHSKAPLAVGFGISSPETAREAASMADGAVVASTVLKLFLDQGGGPDALAAALDKAQGLIQAVHAA